MNLIKAFAVIFFIAIATLTANAQERYEQMTVTYITTSRQMFISTDSGEHEEELVPKSEKKSTYDTSPALVRCKQLSEQGWELYQTSAPAPQIFIFHLRRPLK